MKKSFAEIYVERRLQQWASWYLAIFHGAVGYASKAIEQRIREGGGLYIKGTAPKRIKDHASAEKMDALIVIMTRQNPSMAHVLKNYYLDTGSMEVKAKRLGVSASTFKFELKYAKSWIAGHLSDEIESYAKCQ
jgi:hypothetical protein